MTSSTKRSSQNISPTKHWTDDLPVCSLSGVGFSQNQRYRLDGGRREEHELEDQSFHFYFAEHKPSFYLYGVFDGHSGKKAAEFAAQKLPAELLFGQLTDYMTDDEVKEVLKQAFIVVEKGFFQSIGDELVEKTLIQEDFNGRTEYEAAQQFPEKMERLQEIEREIQSGTTAAVALIYDEKLFVTNVGNSRVVLCTSADDGRLHVKQLSIDHVVTNEDERIRLTKLGLDIEKIRREPPLGKHESTRSIGDYSVKGGYKECGILRNASDEPVIAEPETCGGIPIDGSFYFLILMSDGLYKCLEDSKSLPSEDVNIEIVGLVISELQAQKTINGVCQAVVDRICRLHHDTFMNENGEHCERRDDMTLLLRLFSAKLGGHHSVVTSGQSNISYAFPFQATNGSFQPITPPHPTSLPEATTTDTTGSKGISHEPAVDNVDNTVFVESYVNFSEYFEAIEKYGEDYVANSVQL